MFFVSTISSFFLGITLPCFRAQSCEECCEETSEDSCEDSCEERHVWKCILDLLCAAITASCFRSQSREDCREEAWSECCEEWREECASQCSSTARFEDDVDFRTEIANFQVRDATRH